MYNWPSKVTGVAKTVCANIDLIPKDFVSLHSSVLSQVLSLVALAIVSVLQSQM